jgi:hypothetical protein
MALLVRKVGDLIELNVLLRGGIFSGREIKAALYGLDGKTLVFTTPAATVTFDTNPEGSQQSLSLQDIVEQINATVGLTGYAKAFKSRIQLQKPTGNAAVVLSGTGTANALLGFGDSTVTGVVYAAPGGSAPALVSIESIQQTGAGYLVTTNEA